MPNDEVGNEGEGKGFDTAGIWNLVITEHGWVTHWTENDTRITSDDPLQRCRMI